MNNLVKHAREAEQRAWDIKMLTKIIKFDERHAIIAEAWRFYIMRQISAICEFDDHRIEWEVQGRS